MSYRSVIGSTVCVCLVACTNNATVFYAPRATEQEVALYQDAADEWCAATQGEVCVEIVRASGTPFILKTRGEPTGGYYGGCVWTDGMPLSPLWSSSRGGNIYVRNLDGLSHYPDDPRTLMLHELGHCAVGLEDLPPYTGLMSSIGWQLYPHVTEVDKKLYEESK